MACCSAFWSAAAPIAAPTMAPPAMPVMAPMSLPRHPPEMPPTADPSMVPSCAPTTAPVPVYVPQLLISSAVPTIVIIIFFIRIILFLAEIFKERRIHVGVLTDKGNIYILIPQKIRIKSLGLPFSRPKLSREHLERPVAHAARGGDSGQCCRQCCDDYTHNNLPHILLIQARVLLGAHHIALNARVVLVLRELQFLLHCLYLYCHHCNKKSKI